MRFAVHVVPPNASRSVFSSAKPLTPFNLPTPTPAAFLKTLAVPIKREETIGDLILATEQRFHRAYGVDLIKGLSFGTLKGPLDEDYLETDIVGDLFDESTKIEELFLYLEPSKSKKRTSNNEPDEEPGDTAKRCRVEATEGGPQQQCHDEQAEEEEILVQQTPPSTQPPTSAQPPPSSQSRPSAQPPSSCVTLDFRASQSTFRVFNSNANRGSASKPRATKPRHGSKNPNWNEEEDAVILKGLRQGWTDKQISQKLKRVHRTESAVRGRRRSLKRPRRPTKSRTTAPIDSDAGAVKAAPVAQTPPVVVVTEPRPSRAGTYSNRSKKERWQEALQKAGGDVEMARHCYALILNRENMLDAMAQGDEPEMVRLRAQRRRCLRLQYLADPSRLPRRHDPLAGHVKLPDGMESADEDVIREDDYSTVDEDRVSSMSDDSDDVVEEDQEEDADDSEDGMEFIDGPGVILKEEEPADDIPGARNMAGRTTPVPSAPLLPCDGARV